MKVVCLEIRMVFWDGIEGDYCGGNMLGMV